MLLSFSVLSPPPSTFFLEVEGATDDDLSREDDNDELSPLDLNDDVVYLRLVVDSENLVSVTAMVVPVDLPGENVIVSGTLLVVERTDSEDTEEVVPSEDDPDDMDVVLCRLRLPEEVKSDDDDDVTVIGVVVGIDGNPDELEVGTCTSDTLVDDSNDDDDDIDRLSLIEDIVEDDISSDETADDDRPIEDDFTVSVDSLTNDEVAIRVLSVKLSVGDRVRYDVENELSDIVTVDGLAVGTSDIETLEELELSTVEDDSSKEDDFEVNKLWLLEMSLLLEDAPDSVVSLAELMVDDVLGLDDESGLVVDTSKEDDLT